MTAPSVEAPEANASDHDDLPPATQSMPRPFRLNLLGLSAALALFTRLAAANGFGDLDVPWTLAFLALSSGLGGLSLLLISAERDRISAPLGWITLVTALSWGTLNWISPPFADDTTAFDSSSQPALAALGVGNGLLLAGIVTLALVRRAPTLTVASALLAAVAGLASNTVMLRLEWPSIGVVGAMFLLWLLAWDRAPRREQAYVLPEFSPRFSRAALSLLSVIFCGTALQLWWSRASIPRSLPAVAVAVILVGAAFASMWRVRREIEQRETMLEEWRTWMREIRHTDFRAEMEDFESEATSTSHVEPPRQLSFPNLVGDDDLREDAVRSQTDTGIDPLRTEDTALFDAHATGWLDSPAAPAPLATSIDIPAADEPPATAIDIPAADELPATAIDIPATDIPAADEPPATAIDIPAGPANQLEGQAGTAGPDTADVPPVEVGADLLAWIDGPAFDFPTADTPPLQIDADTPPAAPTVPVALPTADTPRDQIGVVLPSADLPAADIRPDEAPQPDIAAEPGPAQKTTGAFSALLAMPAEATPMQSFATLEALDRWLVAPGANERRSPLLVAVEAMALQEFDTLPAQDAVIATEEIGSYLAEKLPEADLIAWIDGPYFIVAYPSFPASGIPNLSTTVASALKATDGTYAFVRPGGQGQLDDLVEQAVLGLLHARRNQQVMARH